MQLSASHQVNPNPFGQPIPNNQYFGISSDRLVLLNPDKTLKTELIFGLNSHMLVLMVDDAISAQDMQEVIKQCYNARETGKIIELKFNKHTIIFG
jgi:hypothetical protein